MLLVSSQLDKHSRLTKPNKQSGHAPCSIYSQGPCQGRACDCQLVAWIFGLRFQNSWPFVPSMMRLSTPTCYRSWRCINDFNIQRINLLYKKFRLHLTSQHLRFCFSIYFWSTWRRTHHWPSIAVLWWRCGKKGGHLFRRVVQGNGLWDLGDFNHDQTSEYVQDKYGRPGRPGLPVSE